MSRKTVVRRTSSTFEISIALHIASECLWCLWVFSRRLYVYVYVYLVHKNSLSAVEKIRDVLYLVIDYLQSVHGNVPKISVRYTKMASLPTHCSAPSFCDYIKTNHENKCRTPLGCTLSLLQPRLSYRTYLYRPLQAYADKRRASAAA